MPRTLDKTLPHMQVGARDTGVGGQHEQGTACADGSISNVSSGSLPIALSPGVSRIRSPGRAGDDGCSIGRAPAWDAAARLVSDGAVSTTSPSSAASSRGRPALRELLQIARQ